MTTGSQNTAPDTSVDRELRMKLASCPEWCEGGHDGDAPPYSFHRGPKFGHVQVTWSPLEPLIPEGREWTASAYAPEYAAGTGEDELTVPELRAFAADIIAAAEWIEAHR